MCRLTSPAHNYVMRTFLAVLKERHPNAVSAQPVIGPNGAFVSVTLADGNKLTFPIGKKSYTLGEPIHLKSLNALIAEDGQLIATANVYSDAGVAVSL